MAPWLAPVPSLAAVRSDPRDDLSTNASIPSRHWHDDAMGDASARRRGCNATVRCLRDSDPAAACGGAAAPSAQGSTSTTATP